MTLLKQKMNAFEGGVTEAASATASGRPTPTPRPDGCQSAGLADPNDEDRLSVGHAAFIARPTRACGVAHPASGAQSSFSQVGRTTMSASRFTGPHGPF